VDDQQVAEKPPFQARGRKNVIEVGTVEGISDEGGGAGRRVAPIGLSSVEEDVGAEQSGDKPSAHLAASSCPMEFEACLEGIHFS
jgi:hypothetical protein